MNHSSSIQTNIIVLLYVVAYCATLHFYPHSSTCIAFLTLTSVSLIRCKLDGAATIKDERGSWPVQGRAQGSVDDLVRRVVIYSLLSKVYDWNAFVKAILCKIFYIWVCSLNLFVFVKVARGLCARYYIIIAIILSIARLFIVFYKRNSFIDTRILIQSFPFSDCVLKSIAFILFRNKCSIICRE